MNVVITGASRGIGKKIAETFAAAGYHLCLVSRNEVTLYKTLEEMTTRFPEISIKAKAFDLSKKEEAIACGQWCLGHMVPDILINNAGTYEPGNVYNEPDGTLETQMGINFYAAYHLTRSLIGKMIERKSGHIFNICSIAGLKAYANGGSYSISKFAMNGFSKNLREEMKPFNIKVTTVYPGAVFTDSWGDYDNSSNRILVTSDIVNLIFTASKLSPGACVEEIVVRPQLGDL